MTRDADSGRWREVAARQADAVSWAQLLDAGLSRHQVAHRVRTGELRRIHPGVYLAAAAPAGRHRLAWAARLWAGAPAFTSHRAAAAIYLPRLDTPDTVDITVVGHNPGRTRGLAVHRVRRLLRSEVRYVNGLPLTSPARTVLDLAATRPRRETEYVLQELLYERKLSDRELRRAVAISPRHHGTRLLHEILELEGPEGSGVSRSEAERAFARLIRDAHLPRPEKNRLIAGVPVDAVWPDRRLIVEIDGERGHGHALARRRDRERDDRLRAAGWRVIRFTAREVFEQPTRVAAEIAVALAAPA